MAALSKWAKFGVLAMVVADTVGIFVVHHRLNQPAINVPSNSEDVPMAMNETVPALPADAAQAIGAQVTGAGPATALPRDDYRAIGGVAENDFQALPAVSRMDPLPAPMTIEPLALEAPRASAKVAREMQKALRAPVIPTVRIAELHSARKATRTFSSAFSNDISVSTRVTGLEPDVDFAKIRAVRDSAQPVGPANAETRLDPSTSLNENLVASVQAQSSVPAPAFGGTSEPQQLQLDLPAAPAAPETSAPATGEIPAS